MTPQPDPDPPELLGSITDLRASRDPLTPEELELHELRELIRQACAKGHAQTEAILQALAEATNASVLVVRPVDFQDAEAATRLRDMLAKALGCGIALFPSRMNEVFMRAVEVARAEVREAAASKVN